MAEPLSLIASLIALGQAANATCKGLERLISVQTAPTQLYDMFNKIQELKAFIAMVKRIADQSSVTVDEATLGHFKTVLSRATRLVDNANAFVRDKLIRNPESIDDQTQTVKIRKRAFIRSEKKIDSISRDLSNTLNDLKAALDGINSFQLFEIGVRLRSVHQLQLNQQEELSRSINEVPIPRVEELEELSCSQSSSASDEESVLGSHIRLKTNTIEGGSSSTPQHSIDFNLPTSSTSLVTEVGADLVLGEVCNCTCHAPSSIKTPSWLGYAIGTLLVHWPASPDGCQKCSYKPCGKPSSNSSVLRTQYYFPSWIMNRIVQIESRWLSDTGINISLKTPRVVPEDSAIFMLAQHNNIDGVKKLFEQRLASPFDVSPKGRTPLHFAATAVRAEMIEFLVKQKSDKDVEDHDNLSANDIIWELYLRNPTKRRFILDAAGLSLNDTASLEKQCLSGVHRIVLGLKASCDLDTYLSVSSAEIDKQDLTGKTALAWAASRKDVNTVRTLLKYTASVDIPDLRGKTPLHYAAGSGAPESVRIILDKIKSIQDKLPTGTKSLIESSDDKGRTPLNYATRMNLEQQTEILIEYDAQLEATETKSGRTILLNAIYWNSHRVLPILLRRGARTDVCDTTGATILHHVARFGDLKTLQIMAEHKIGHVPIEATDSRGMTALQVFDSLDARCSPEEGEDRELAVELFSKILKNASRERAHSIVEQASGQEIDGDARKNDSSIWDS